jgi:hypothetical protein
VRHYKAREHEKQIDREITLSDERRVAGHVEARKIKRRVMEQHDPKRRETAQRG